MFINKTPEIAAHRLTQSILLKLTSLESVLRSRLALRVIKDRQPRYFTHPVIAPLSKQTISISIGESTFEDGPTYGEQNGLVQNPRGPIIRVSDWHRK